MYPEIFKQIKPSKKEEQKFSNVVNSFLKKLNSKLKDAQAVLGGSGAKDTWLSGGHDIDVYVLFNYKKFGDRSDELSDHLDQILKKLFKRRKRLHGSRDYFQINYQNYVFEIIPILKIVKASQAKNITDVSPLHVKWVKKQREVKDEIRLIKQFAKANDCYGAESYINGFSGYVLEILTAFYGSFSAFLKKAARWESKKVIDIENHYPRNKVFRSLNQSKLKSPLIVIDPVDKTRNAAAALSLEKFILFRQKAIEFLQSQNLDHFKKKKITLKQLEKETKHNIVYVEIQPLTGKHDVVGGKLLKCFQFIKKELADFSLADANWQWDGKATFYFIVEKRQIDPFFIRKGPPLKLTEQVERFKKKHKECYERRRRVYAKIPRKNYFLKPHVQEVVKNKYIKERVKGIKKVVIA